jgi:hypothetical protein
MFRRVLREPLVHFLLAGAVLFAVFGRREPEASSQDKEIVVSAADVERLGQVFERTWRRPPSDDEMQKAVNDFVREEVLYRTALSLGLDKDDTIIRRRLRQKMDFLFEDTVSVAEESELRAFYAAHQDKFRAEALGSFRQIFIDTKRHDNPEGDARQLLRRLLSGQEDELTAGDPILLAESYSQTPMSQIAALFGDVFADELAKTPRGKWSGPLNSSFGLHLVRVTGIEDAHGSPSPAPILVSASPTSSSASRLPSRQCRSVQAANLELVTPCFREFLVGRSMNAGVTASERAWSRQRPKTPSAAEGGKSCRALAFATHFSNLATIRTSCQRCDTQSALPAIHCVAIATSRKLRRPSISAFRTGGS